MKYKRLTIEEREQIHALVNQGKSNREIAISLKRSHTTISKELKRCGTKYEYSPTKADKKARNHLGCRSIVRCLYSAPNTKISKIKALPMRLELCHTKGFFL